MDGYGKLKMEKLQLRENWRGTIQDAVFDGEDWRIISWREDIMLRGESVSRDDLGVQILNHDGNWMVIDNQGEITPYMGG